MIASDVIDDLANLAELHHTGEITDEEYTAAKAMILHCAPAPTIADPPAPTAVVEPEEPRIVEPDQSMQNINTAAATNGRQHKRTDTSTSIAKRADKLRLTLFVFAFAATFSIAMCIVYDLPTRGNMQATHRASIYESTWQEQRISGTDKKSSNHTLANNGASTANRSDDMQPNGLKNEAQALISERLIEQNSNWLYEQFPNGGGTKYGSDGKRLFSIAGKIFLGHTTALGSIGVKDPTETFRMASFLTRADLIEMNNPSSRAALAAMRDVAAKDQKARIKPTPTATTNADANRRFEQNVAVKAESIRKTSQALFERHASWIYENDKTGKPVVGPDGGRKLSFAGEMCMYHLIILERLGAENPTQDFEMAIRLTTANLIEMRAAGTDQQMTNDFIQSLTD